MLHKALSAMSPASKAQQPPARPRPATIRNPHCSVEGIRLQDIRPLPKASSSSATPSSSSFVHPSEAEAAGAASGRAGSGAPLMDNVGPGGAPRRSSTGNAAASPQSHAAETETRPLVFANRTLLAWENYSELLEFLRAPSLSPDNPLPLAHDLDPSRFAHVNVVRITRAGQRNVEAVRSIDDLENKLDQQQDSLMVFFSGHSDPNWLGKMKRLLGVSPGFLNRHLARQTNHFGLGVSVGDPFIAQVTFTTIATMGKTGDTATPLAFAPPQAGREFPLGSSKFRGCFTHTDEHFSLEQTVSLELRTHKNSWTVIIWSDFGESSKPADGPNGVRSSRAAGRCNTHAAPWYSAVSALSDEVSIERDCITECDQTLQYLPQHLGESLNHRAMFRCPFYAVSEIYQLFAASEENFLQFVDFQVREVASKAISKHHEMIQKLHDLQSILRIHAVRIHEALTAVKTRGGRRWREAEAEAEATVTKAEAEAEATVTKAEVSVVDACEDLVIALEGLARRVDFSLQACADKMSALGNDSAALSSRTSISQGDVMLRLTYALILLVPIQLMTSVFGMNLSSWAESGVRDTEAVVVSVGFVVGIYVIWFLTDQRVRKFMAAHFERFF